MSRKNVFITIVVVLIGAAVVFANVYYKKDKGLAVTTEVIKARDLEAIVSASGKIQPKRLVNISADTPGRVVNLAVNEGDRIHKGQFLLQIDPKSLSTRVDSGSASLQANILTLEGMRQSIETARAQLVQAQQNLTRQQDLWKQQLTTREALEKADNDVKVAQSSVQEREKQLKPQESRIAQERATLESARYDLSKVRIESPIDGIVTRRNIQEGETAVIGTMNNAGTVLLTLATCRSSRPVETTRPGVPNVSRSRSRARFPTSRSGSRQRIGNSPLRRQHDRDPPRWVVVLDKSCRTCVSFTRGHATAMRKVVSV
jgi:HlyD family secretion protein